MTLSRLTANSIINASEHTKKLDDLFQTKLRYARKFQDFEACRHTFYRQFPDVANDIQAILFKTYCERRQRLNELASITYNKVNFEIVLNHEYEVDVKKTVAGWFNQLINKNAKHDLSRSALLEYAAITNDLRYFEYAMQGKQIEFDISLILINMLKTGDMQIFNYLWSLLEESGRRYFYMALTRSIDRAFFSIDKVELILGMYEADNEKTHFLLQILQLATSHDDLPLCDHVYGLLKEEERDKLHQIFIPTRILYLLIFNHHEMYNWVMSHVNPEQREMMCQLCSDKLILFFFACDHSKMDVAADLWSGATYDERHAIYVTLLKQLNDDVYTVKSDLIAIIWPDLPLSARYTLLMSKHYTILSHAIYSGNLALCQAMGELLDDWNKPIMLLQQKTLNQIYHKFLPQPANAGYFDVCDWFCRLFAKHIEPLRQELTWQDFFKNVPALKWYLAWSETETAVMQDKSILKKMFDDAFEFQRYDLCVYIMEELNPHHFDLLSEDNCFLDALNLMAYDVAYLFWQHATPELRLLQVQKYVKEYYRYHHSRSQQWLLRESCDAGRNLIFAHLAPQDFETAFMKNELTVCQRLWDDFAGIQPKLLTVGLSKFYDALGAGFLNVCRWLWGVVERGDKKLILGSLEMSHLEKAAARGDVEMCQWLMSIQTEVIEGYGMPVHLMWGGAGRRLAPHPGPLPGIGRGSHSP